MTAPTYAVDTRDGDVLCVGLLENDARRVAQSYADRLGESVYLYQDGSAEPAIEVEPSPALDLVIVELMPDYLRETHRAARNWGTYPLNGAVRKRMPRARAEDTIARDPDGYARIVGGGK